MGVAFSLLVMVALLLLSGEEAWASSLGSLKSTGMGAAGTIKETSGGIGGGQGTLDSSSPQSRPEAPSYASTSARGDASTGRFSGGGLSSNGRGYYEMPTQAPEVATGVAAYDGGAAQEMAAPVAESAASVLTESAGTGGAAGQATETAVPAAPQLGADVSGTVSRPVATEPVPEVTGVTGVGTRAVPAASGNTLFVDEVAENIPVTEPVAETTASLNKMASFSALDKPASKVRETMGPVTSGALYGADGMLAEATAADISGLAMVATDTMSGAASPLSGSAESLTGTALGGVPGTLKTVEATGMFAVPAGGGSLADVAAQGGTGELPAQETPSPVGTEIFPEKLEEFGTLGVSQVPVTELDYAASGVGAVPVRPVGEALFAAERGTLEVSVYEFYTGGVPRVEMAGTLTNAPGGWDSPLPFAAPIGGAFSAAGFDGASHLPGLAGILAAALASGLAVRLSYLLQRPDSVLGLSLDRPG